MAQKKVFDKNILIVIGFIVLLAIIVLIFKGFNKKPCPEVNAQCTTGEPMTGTPVTFTDRTDGATSWDWDFGDSSAHATMINPTHTYTTPGDYTVTLRVNGSCDQSIRVTVGSPVVADPAANLPEGHITGPASITLGQPATFTDDSKDATSWEWSFGESGVVDAKTKLATYTYRTAGSKEIHLTINGKSKIAILKVNVLYQPPKDHNNPYDISEADFAKKLNELHNPDKSSTDFEKILNGNLNMTITVNGKETIFASYCTSLNFNKHNVTRVVLTKSQQKYITAIAVTDEKPQ